MHILILGLFLFILTALPGQVTAGDEAAASGEVAIKILHTNDTHAHVDSHEVGYGKDTEEVGGFPRIISFVKSVREKDKNTLLLSAGDVFQGTLYFNFFRGLADYEFMNMAGYDAACFGNHEFDEGPSWLLEAVEKLNCEKVNCNVLFGKSYAGVANKVKPYVIKEVNGLKIAIIGAVTQNLFTLVNSKNLTDLELVNPVEAIAPIVKELRPKVDMILVLSHMGLKEDLELAELVADIDLIIGGHSHSLLVAPVVLRTSKGQQVVINQAYEKGEFVGEVNMAFSRGTKKWRLVDGKLNRMDKNVPKDETAVKMIEDYKKKINSEVKTVIGENIKPLIGDKDSVRAGETNLGNLVADSLKNHAGADIGIINGGSLRNSINKGPISLEQCINVFPFNNLVAKLTMKGNILRSAFELIAKKRQSGTFGGFLHVLKGMKVAYKEGKLIELSLNGQPINDNTLYTVAMSDFTAAGGDGFTMFATVADRFTDGVKVCDAIIELIKQLKTIDMDTEGRIK